MPLLGAAGMADAEGDAASGGTGVDPKITAPGIYELPPTPLLDPTALPPVAPPMVPDPVVVPDPTVTPVPGVLPDPVVVPDPVVMPDPVVLPAPLDVVGWLVEYA